MTSQQNHTDEAISLQAKMMSQQNRTDANTTSTESKQQVGDRLESLVDTYTTNSDVHAAQSILAISNPDNTDSTSEIHPQDKTPWYRRLADKVGAFITKDAAYYSYGNYVYHPDTKETVFEFMPLYARLGMHALFCGSLQEDLLEDGYLLELFKSQSVKSGAHFDTTESALSIPGFVKTYSLSLDELLVPDITHGYKTFNEFFSRKLKADARPPANPEDARVSVSPADCRAVVFETVTEGQKFWIKGDRFSIPNLLQNSVPNVEAYTDCSIGIFRLAPQDYHRFHSPVSGTIVAPPGDIDGGLFTVNPMAVKSTLDVLTSNKRSTLAILTPYSRTPVLVIAVGALLVGSISWTVNTSPGTTVTKGQELGYFSYGGSTVIVLWPADASFKVESLLKEKSEKSDGAVECLVKVGRKVGVAGAAPVI